MTRFIAILAAAAIGLAAGCSNHDAEQASARKSSPDVDAVWQQIDAERADLVHVLNAGMLDEVHEHAFAIRGLVTKLPRTASRLRPDQSARLAGMAQTVAAQAEEMSTAASSGDTDATSRCLQTLNTSLTDLRAISGAQ